MSADELTLRRLLWLRHNPEHYPVLYGDDGEMQCGICLLDFKRDTPDAIATRFDEQAWAEIVKAAVAKSEAPR